MRLPNPLPGHILESVHSETMNIILNEKLKLIVGHPISQTVHANRVDHNERWEGSRISEQEFLTKCNDAKCILNRDFHLADMFLESTALNEANQM